MTDKPVVRDWRSDDVTRYLFKQLEETKSTLQRELMNIGPEVESLPNIYHYLRGKIAGIDEILDIDLEDTYEKDV